MAAKTPEYNVKKLSGRNKIINGDMRIDQRNVGNSTTLTNGVYNLDRWAGQKSNAGVVTVQRVTDSLPAGFTHAMKLTVTTADATVAAGDYDGFHQYIEGYNCADFDFGKSTAKDIVISFWVRSSKTGIYSGAIMNAASNRSRTFEYTINATNTWEYKTITIPGDITGTWLVDHGLGMRVFFSLMTGTTYQQAAGAWGTSGNAVGTSNQVNWLDTLGATFYMTGVQLEVGNVATPFERKGIGQIIQECQRYYEKSFHIDTLPANSGSTTTLVDPTNAIGYVGGNTVLEVQIPFTVMKRVAPTVVQYGNSSGRAIYSTIGNGAITASVSSATGPVGASGVKGFNVNQQDTGQFVTVRFHFTADAEL